MGLRGEQNGRRERTWGNEKRKCGEEEEKDGKWPG